MAEPALRSRVERLLRGQFVVDDLTRLFLYARDRCDGRESVQEIGDFVAHHSERNKGLITRTTRDWYYIVSVAIPAVTKPLDSSKLPPLFPEFLRATHRRSNLKEIRKALGLDHARSARLLESAINKLERNPDGTFALSATLSPSERDAIQYFASRLIVRCAFNDDRLFDDFAATMRSHSLLRQNEMESFEQLKPVIAMFAVAVMHLCSVQVDSGTSLHLNASASGANIDVQAMVPTPHPKGGVVHIAQAIFETSLDRSYCEAELLAISQPWGFELEVTPNRRLGKLG